MSYLQNPHFLFPTLLFLLSCSVFFSLAETALLSVNRYRIRHLARQNHRLAKRVQQLLERPDRMLGVILLCDTFADILASAVATILALHYFGDKGVIVVTLGLTLVVLIFGEITPKTLAALYPQPMAFFSVWPLIILLHCLYPFVWLANSISNGILRLFGVRLQSHLLENLNHEELRTMLHEAGGRLPSDYQSMLLKVLDLENATVEDVMIPRNEIVGIDLNDDWENILKLLTTNQHNRLPLYRENVDDAIGVLHLRKVLNLLAAGKLNKESLVLAADKNYFIPEGTPLNIQLVNFQKEKCRVGMVVNEYGEIQGLLALEDILEEIVGEFTTDISVIASRTISPQPDGSYLVEGSISIRDLNKILHRHLPVDGPKTLNGLILEYLESIPHEGIWLRISNSPMEIIEVKGNIIKKVRILPPLTN